MSAESPRVPNPSVTGGPGDHFEQHVGAYLLALLLTRCPPPIILNTQLHKVHFQAGRLGWQTDDLVFVGRDASGLERRVAAQVKLGMMIGTGNEECVKTISRFWSDFSNEALFAVTRDRLCLIVRSGTNTLIKHFAALLDCARASTDSSDFFHRLFLDGHFDSDVRRHVSVVREIVEAQEGNPVSDDQLWNFLSTVHVMSLDLFTSTAHIEAVLLGLLASTATETLDPQTAHSSWLELLKTAAWAKANGESLTREQLPDTLLDRHDAILASHREAVQVLRDHTRVVLEGIRNAIGSNVHIPRTDLVDEVLRSIEQSRIVLVTGPAGSGKSVIARNALESLTSDFVIAFRAEELRSPHLDNALSNAQINLTTRQLSEVLAGQPRKILLVESVERLLEGPERQAFGDLVRHVRDNTDWRLLLTCRDYSADLVRHAFLLDQGPEVLIEIQPLVAAEVDIVCQNYPNLSHLVESDPIRRLLSIPYILDMATRAEWEGETIPRSERELRLHLWDSVVANNTELTDGLPRRREDAIIELSVRRARTLRVYIPSGDDTIALQRLHADSLVRYAPESNVLAAPAHDVLEDWAILSWLDDQLARHDGDIVSIADDVADYPALRRSYRHWLQERLAHEPAAADRLVLAAIQSADVPLHFKDETVVALLRSGLVESFLERQPDLLARNDHELLQRFIHLLRVGCMSKPPWLAGAGSPPSALLVPSGSGWAAILKLIAPLVSELLPNDAGLLLGLIENWSQGVNWWDPEPAGAESAAEIAFALLPHFSDYDYRSNQRLTLKVLLKIPRARPSDFIDLLQRATARDRFDELAESFSSLLLDGMDGYCACRDFPSEVVGLAQTRFCVTDEEVRQEMPGRHYGSVEPIFGIREELGHEFFPPSALRGPFLPLLRTNTAIGLDCVIGLLNHAADWYFNRKWPSDVLEGGREVTLSIPLRGDRVQYANSRFWGLFRGITVAPGVLQCAAMGLEKWLLDLGAQSPEHLDLFLVKCLTDSNNAAISAVVASVCNAYPEHSGEAAQALLSCREFLLMDRARMVGEDSINLINALPHTDADQQLYQEERTVSAKLEHRRADLEQLAVRLQFGPHRDAVLAIIDRHREELPPMDEQTDEDRLWRLALNRIDSRDYHAVSASEAEVAESEDNASPDSQRQYLVAGDPEPDIQEMLDSRAEQFELQQTLLALQNWGMNTWESQASSDYAEWQEAYEACQRDPVANNTEDTVRGGPGFIAAVGVRDHWDAMGSSRQLRCVEALIAEILRDAADFSINARIAQNSFSPAGPAAFLISKVAREKHLDDPGSRIDDAVVTAVLHPNVEVAISGARGLGHFLTSSNRDFVLQCLGCLGHMASLDAVMSEAESRKPYLERRDSGVISQLALGQARKLMRDGRLDALQEIARLNLTTWAGRNAARSILETFSYTPSDTTTLEFYETVSTKIAEFWASGRDDGPTRDHDFEHVAGRLIARCAIRLPHEDALRLCRPLAAMIDRYPKDLAGFVGLLIQEEDAITGTSSFWHIWNHVSSLLPGVPWLSRLSSVEYSYESELVQILFLGVDWKEDTSTWSRLESHGTDIEALFRSLPPSPVAYESYSRFLNSIGRETLPQSFHALAHQLGDAHQVALLTPDTRFYLETILRPFVYADPRIVKSDPALRKSVLHVLDKLVQSGSSSAFQMRDDFVTPLPSD